MLRPTTLLPALVAVVATLAGVSPATAARGSDARPTAAGSTIHPMATHVSRAAHAPRAAADRTPLSVTIDSLSPSYVPRKGPVRVTGSVTNEDDAAWTKVYVFAFMGDTPIRSTAELADTSDVDPAADVGARITADGSYDVIDRIKPGQTMQFSLRVPRSLLPASEPGVYWFGVHALGSGPEGRLEGADGRARTFLPLVPRTKQSVDTALVLPLRRTVSYAPDGSVEDVADWNTALSPGGRLRSMVDFGASAGFRPITWLLDPGLPDVVRALTLANPPRSLTPDLTQATDNASQASDPEATPSPSDGTDTGGDQTEDPDLAAVTESGNAWLDRLHEALDGRQILALPYGDVDVSAAADRDPALYRRARKRSGTELAPWGLPMSPAVASPGGYLNPAALGPTPSRSTVLVTDKMFGDDPPPVAQTKGARLVTTSSAAATGGPGPDDPLAPVAMRQRILAEAALRLLEPGHPPLVVVLPSYWNPSTTTGFFEGLDVDWLHLTTVSDVADRSARTVSADSLDYPARLSRSELDSANFSSAQDLVKAGQTLQNVLTDNDTVASTVADQAMRSTSYGHRASPDGARASTDRSRSWIEQELGSIRIVAPPAVTLSSTSGRFAATLTNALDEPVTVSIQALTDEPRAIRGPEKVEIGPGGRATVLLNASFRRLGVHNVTLVATDSEGVRLGSSDQLPIRSAQVSKVIWLILGTGVALLFGAIGVRLVRRVRAAARAARQP